MTLHFATLFDSYYMSRGLAMYNSLKSVCPDFHLYIFAFDKNSEVILKKMELPHVSVISLSEFEDERLLAIKSTRTKGEYCWTCTSSTIHYCITRFNLDHCTYVDADLYFFSDPRVLVDEMGDKSVLITEHRYTKKYDQSVKSGIYCVQFVTFKNTVDGMKVLSWWRDRCIEWCYDRFEDGKFGDQKYLDTWAEKFTGIHVLKHLGGGLAPWNIQQFQVREEAGNFKVIERTSGSKFDVIFYHFHALRFLKDDAVDLGAYTLSAESKNLYAVYLRGISAADDSLRLHGFQPVVQSYQTKSNIPHPLHKVIRFLLGVYNIDNMNNIISYGKIA